MHNEDVELLSTVSCPTPPDNCLHDTYVAPGIGCAGCQLCAAGHVVTFNPRYLNTSLNTHGTYVYMGIQVRHDIDMYVLTPSLRLLVQTEYDKLVIEDEKCPVHRCNVIGVTKAQNR